MHLVKNKYDPIACLNWVSQTVPKSMRLQLYFILHTNIKIGSVISNVIPGNLKIPVIYVILETLFKE